MRTQILIAALILSTSASAQTVSRGLIAAQPNPVETPAYKVQAAEQTQVPAQPADAHPAQEIAVNATHVLQKPVAQPPAARAQQAKRQRQAQQQQAQQRMMQQRRMQQQQMQQHAMQQQMARKMPLKDKVAYKVHEVETKLKAKLVDAIFR